MPLRHASAVALALLMAGPATSAAAAAPPAQAPGVEAHHGYDPHTLLVRFVPGIAAASHERTLARHAATVVGKVPGSSFVKLRTSGEASVVLRALQKDSAVQAAALDRHRRPAVVPDDPLYTDGSQPYLSTVRLPEAWDLVRDASSQVIAVVDTGVDHLHPDLAGRTVAGYNVVNPAAPPTDYLPIDYPEFGGHGTMVAGIAAANTGNGTGIAGAAWTGRIMPIKVFRSNGFALDSDIATGIAWAVDHGARIINLSLGGPGDSPVLHEAIRYATNNGALVVAAGGNSADATTQYPAAFPEVLAVSATDSAGVLTSFSTRGDWIDVAAPGYRIISTIPSADRRMYLTGNGTSFSAPMVSGVAALVRARFPALTPAQVHARLRDTTRDAGPHGIDQFYGHGILDALHAVGGPAGAEFPRPTFRLREPNDVPARAEALFQNSVSWAAIEVEGDVDWFRWESASTRTVEFRLTPPPVDHSIAQNIDPILTVYDAQLRWLGEADSRGPGGIESLFLGVAPGTHYISVRNYNGGRLPTNTYEVRVATPSAPPPAFQAPLSYPVGARPNSVAVGDVTGDGRADALLTTRSGGAADQFKLFVFAQNADGSLAAPVGYQTRLSWGDDDGAGLGVLDIDRDGRLDVALATSAGVEVFEQSGSGALEPGRLLPGTAGAAHLVAADMDTDGDADLVVNGSAGILLLTHEPDGNLLRSVVSADRPGEIEVGDVDGDGRADIAGFSGTRIQVYHRGDFGWSRTEHETVRADDLGVSGIEVADVTGDGRADIVAALGGNYPSSRLNVFRQTAGGGLSIPDVHQTRDIPEPIEAADLDGDSRADVVTVHGGHRLLSTLMQRSDGTLGAPLTNTLPYATSYHVQGLALGDVTGDGRPDAVIADYNTGMLVLADQAGRAPGRDRLWVRDMTPADFAVGVAQSATPSVAFQRVIDPASVDASTVSLVHGRTGIPVAATVSFDVAANSVTLHPAGPLESDTPYRIIVGAVRDHTGSVHIGRVTATFRMASGP
ncbi:S8 family serine peptidase [Allorhizocola rhizosphaerae]|uniref:S8 family serine peptidase n=1 Tax=Allorhizocola rhizosphaerae TaxID=1872709 RepID=UPI0013C2E764|nr:S8 family serine peptidase [Allorhizocola rhizosphaerae]